ncbi:MAG: cardiolipin synthase [Canibacter sp.]
MIFDLSSWSWPWVLVTVIPFIIDNGIRIAALFVVPRNRRPSSGTAWLLLIFLLPVPGILFFWLIGGFKLPKSRRKKYDAVTQQIEAIASREEFTFPVPPEDRSEGLENAVKIGRALGAQPMLGGNEAHLLADYDASIRAMADAIREAKSYVHIQFYIFVLDDTTQDLFDAMRDAVARGVDVRALLDYWGSLNYSGMYRTRRALDDAGVQWSYMLPVRPWRGEYQRPDLRNHRKILVIDNKVAFMGSQNLIDSTYNKRSNIRRGLHWKDLMVRIEGPAVLGLDAVFKGDWYTETDEVLPDATEVELPIVPGANLECQIVPSGPAFATENNLQVFVALMYAASKRISITSPYFIPDGGLMHAIQGATARGVDVELFVSEIGDQPVVYHAQRSYYEELLKRGVRIYMYKPPIILHSKHFTIDDDVAMIGSSNMDQRSFNLNMEVSLIAHGAQIVRELDEVNDYYRENSRELTLEEWLQQPLRSKLLDNLARLTSSLQ